MKPKILFVDDEERVLKAMQRLFARDCEVEVANNGYDALELQRSHDFDVIVCDQLMPEMTGVEVLRATRKQSPRTIRILLTGQADLVAAIQAVNEGEIYRYINKPWDNQELITTVLEAARLSRIPPAPPAEEKPLESSIPHHILLVDQDAELAGMVDAVIPDKVTLHTVDSPERALEMVGQQEIATVIIDTAMGGDATTQLVFDLHQKYPQIIIIVVTYRADISHLVELINSGRIYRFLPKPVRLSILQPNIASALAKYERITQMAEQHAKMEAESAASENDEAQTDTHARATNSAGPNKHGNNRWRGRLSGWIERLRAR
ncbi:MAG: response regulator [Xanthomonadales bacterium]|nr:response regulator [Xanthomonadales bacterium]